MFKQLEEIRDTLLTYVETRIDLFQIQTRQKLEVGVLYAVYGFILGSCVLGVVILATVLLAVYLNNLLDSPYYGYLILMGVFILKIALVVIFRKSYLNFIRRIMEAVMRNEE